MKKCLAVFSASCMLICSFAFSQKNIRGLVDAEKAFASFTQTHTIREGFLKYMDSNGVVFRQGIAVNALDAFQKQAAGSARLNWEPAFVVISASGDFGITTGPYILHPKPLQDTPVAYGNFSSVWIMNKQGEWKNLVDLGVSCTKRAGDVKQVQEIILAPKTMMVPVSFDDVLTLDKKFNQDLTIATQLSADSWLNIEGEAPVTGIQMISNVLMHIPDTVLFHSETGKISTAGDLAYVYGSVVNGNKKENYLRVWANRNKRWQVILQTIK